MPRDVNGVYTLPAGNPVQAGTVIDPNWANTTLNDIADALTDSLDITDPATARSRLGLGKAATANTSDYMVTMLDDANAATARTTLGLGSSATHNMQATMIDATAGVVFSPGSFGLGGAAWNTQSGQLAS